MSKQETAAKLNAVQFVFTVENVRGLRSTGGYDHDFVVQPRGKVWSKPQDVRSHVVNETYDRGDRVVVYALVRVEDFDPGDFANRIHREASIREEMNIDAQFFQKQAHTPLFMRLARKFYSRLASLGN